MRLGVFWNCGRRVTQIHSWSSQSVAPNSCREPCWRGRRERARYMNRQKFNPHMPKVLSKPKTPGGGCNSPPRILAFPSEFFENISHGHVFRNRESNDDNEKILSLLHDLENQGQTPFCMTFLIYCCEHGTKLILVSILTFYIFEVEDIKNVEINHVTLTVDLWTQGHTHSLYDLS